MSSFFITINNNFHRTYNASSPHNKYGSYHERWMRRTQITLVHPSHSFGKSISSIHGYPVLTLKYTTEFTHRATDWAREIGYEKIKRTKPSTSSCSGVPQNGHAARKAWQP